jgi:hypothetical protein
MKILKINLLHSNAMTVNNKDLKKLLNTNLDKFELLDNL